jgi:hypothetical protein
MAEWFKAAVLKTAAIWRFWRYAWPIYLMMSIQLVKDRFAQRATLTPETRSRVGTKDGTVDGER